MELLQLKYFCDAAKTENFSQTAKKYLVPVSNISQSIKRLEKEVGTELFEHKGNRIKLNYSGKEFYKYVSKSLMLLECAKDCVRDPEDDFSGDIRLNCISNYKSVTVAIEKFLLKYPNVNFIIHQNSEINMEYDILISDIFPAEHGEKVLLFDEEIYVAMSKNNPLVKKETLYFSDLEGERFIALSQSDSLKRIMIKCCEEAGFLPNFTIQTYSTSFLRRYISMGLGISFVPAPWSEKYSSDMVFKKIGNIRRKTYAFLSKETHIKKSIQVFLEFIKKETS